MKKSFIILIGIICSLGFVTPTYATDGDSVNDAVLISAEQTETTAPHETFKETTTSDGVKLDFGGNLLLAGNAASLDETTVNGLLFGFGNQVQMTYAVRSDYAFVAGNIIEYSAASTKDLFAAGATININKDAHIGRDVYATGNIVKVEADLPGDLSIAAAQATLRNVKIAGNVNLSVDRLVIEGRVIIDGKINVNDDATIVGLSNAKYAEIEKYTNINYEPTAAELWMSKLYSVIALFVVFGIILAIYSQLNQHIENRLTMTNFGIDLVTGCVFLILVPVLIIFLLISLIGAPAALILLALYVVTIYLAQGFAGFWFGKLIVEKVAKSQTNQFVEALLGIALLGCISLVPFAGWIVGLWSTALGCGLIIQAIRPRKTSPTLDAPKQVASSKKAIVKSTVTKNAAKATKSKTPKSTKD